MPYSHYGEIGDLWKHLPLCSFLTIENPTKYFESNAAYPKYELDHTSEREYGIFNLVTKSRMNDFKALANTPFLTTLFSVQEANDLKQYLGSPGLAIELLGNSASYVFCDIESLALQAQSDYAAQKKIHSVQTIQGDSINSLWSLVEQGDSHTFLHIDPYRIFDKNDYGRSYFDLFVKSMKCGIKTMLWFGYDAISNRQHSYKKMNEIFESNRVDLKKHKVNCIELEIESIGSETTSVNPGVPGCGVMIANMSIQSNDALHQTCDMLVNVYDDVQYLGGSGRLNKRITFEN